MLDASVCAMLLLVFLLMGACGRERGQEHSWLGTTGARMLFWAFPCGLLFYFFGAGYPYFAALSGFLGLVLVPHGAGQNLNVPWKEPEDGSWPEEDSLKGICVPERLGYLLSVGVVRLWFFAISVGLSQPDAADWLPFAAPVVPLGYLAGLYLPKLPWRLTKATEWGEFLSFGGIGVALAYALYGG